MINFAYRSTSEGWTSSVISSLISMSRPSLSFRFGRSLTAMCFSQPPLQATVFQASHNQPRFAHSTSLMASGLVVHFLTSAKVLRRSRNMSWLYGWKFGGLRGVDAVCCACVPTTLMVPAL
jgi:hypothetical protein